MTIVVCWEFMDGSCRAVDCDDDDEAHELATYICEQHTNARVWIGESLVQRGFIAADERNEEPWT